MTHELPDVQAMLYKAGQVMHPNCNKPPATPTEPTIADAKDLAYRLRKEGVIVLTISNGRISGVSYGHTRAKCKAMGKVLDAIVDRLASGEIEVQS